jgi:hypothetical protein
MFARLRDQLAVIACGLITVSGFATGLALGCSGNYCSGSVRGCTPLYETVQESCCKDFDGDGVRHCVTCLRDRYLCYSGPARGPAYNCSGAGAVCS